jgi:hypothetical protein
MDLAARLLGRRYPREPDEPPAAATIVTLTVVDAC